MSAKFTSNYIKSLPIGKKEVRRAVTRIHFKSFCCSSYTSVSNLCNGYYIYALLIDVLTRTTAAESKHNLSEWLGNYTRSTEIKEECFVQDDRGNREPGFFHQLKDRELERLRGKLSIRPLQLIVYFPVLHPHYV